jgi:hypothetical protein
VVGDIADLNTSDRPKRSRRVGWIRIIDLTREAHEWATSAD